MPPTAETFKYEAPPLDHGKAHVPVGRTDHWRADVQLIKDGGDTNLHAHAGVDGLWMVLSGRAKFYGEGDVVMAEIGKHETIILPHGTAYWFEMTGDEPLEILHVAISVPGIKDQRIDHTPRRVRD